MSTSHPTVDESPQRRPTSITDNAWTTEASDEVSTIAKAKHVPSSGGRRSTRVADSASAADLRNRQDMERIVQDAAGYQRSQLVKMVCLMAMPTVTLVVISMVAMTTSLSTTSSTQALNDRISVMVKFTRLLAAVQVREKVI